jgi:hypothetical protein
LGDAKVTLAVEGMQRRADEARLMLLNDGRIGHVVATSRTEAVKVATRRASSGWNESKDTLRRRAPAVRAATRA